MSRGTSTLARGLRSPLARSVALYCGFLLLYGGLMFLLPRSAGPRVDLYGGPLEFDGERAFADLRTLAETYPDRVTGSSSYAGAAGWVARCFEELGLQPIEETFSALAEKASPAAGDERFSEVTAPNVTAIVPGETDEVVAVFAHLDTVARSPGADDNASGVAAVLGLARVLAAGRHRFTYVFVIVGGEETGLWGSRDWARAHISGPDHLFRAAGATYGPLRLAVGLDCVAWSGGVYPCLYSLGSGGHKVDLGTMALAAALMDDRVPAWRDGYALLRRQVLYDSGALGSDQFAFIEAGVSAICFGRQAKPSWGSPYLNSPKDTLEQVSPETLADAGRVAEMLLRTFEQSDLTAESGDHSYLLCPKGFTPGWMVWLAGLSLVAFSFLAGVRTSARSGTQWREELGWYGAVVVWGLLLAVAMDLVASPNLALLWVGLPWLAIVASSLAVLAWLRLRLFWPRAEGTNDSLSLMLGVWGLIGLALLGPARLIYQLIIPALVLSRLRGQSRGGKVIFRLVLIVWALGWLRGILGTTGDFTALFRESVFSDILPVRAWLLGLGLCVFPTVWQATAVEHPAVAVLVAAPPDGQDGRLWLRTLTRQPVVRAAGAVYCSPEPEAFEVATAMGRKHPAVIPDFAGILAPPEGAAGSAEELELVEKALDRVQAEQATEAAPEPAPDVAPIPATGRSAASPIGSAPRARTPVLVVMPPATVALCLAAFSAARRVAAEAHTASGIDVSGGLTGRAGQTGGPMPLRAGPGWSRLLKGWQQRVRPPGLAVVDLRSRMILRGYRRMT